MRGGEGGICDGVNAMGWTAAFWSVDACDGGAELFCGFAEFWAVLACCELARATPPNSNTSVNLSGMARLVVIQPVLYDTPVLLGAQWANLHRLTMSFCKAKLLSRPSS